MTSTSTHDGSSPRVIYRRTVCRIVVATMKDDEQWDMKLTAWSDATGRITAVDVTDYRLRAWRGQAGQMVSTEDGEQKA